MRVAVIIPTYNRAHLIGETLGSVLAQTRPVDEIIVMDDGSEDDTEHVVRSCCPQARYIRLEHSGSPCRPMNVGMEVSSADYVGFLDSDDLWLPTKIEKQLAAFDANPEVGMVYCYSRSFTSSPEETEGWVWGPRPETILGQPAPEDAFPCLLAYNYIASITPLMRRVTVDKVGKFDESIHFSEDHDYWLRIALDFPIYCIDEVLALQRLHQGNITLRALSNAPFYTKVVEKNTRLAGRARLSAADERLAKRNARRMAAEALVTSAYRNGHNHKYALACLTRAMTYDPTFCAGRNHVWKNWANALLGMSGDIFRGDNRGGKQIGR